MKDDKYIVETRYEYLSDNGKIFTDWFVLSSDERTEAEAKEYIKQVSKDYAHVDKLTKCKHEYRYRTIDELSADLAKIQKEIDKARVRDEAYYSSDKWKELKHKKYVSRKERKAKQEEYNKMMQELKKDEAQSI